VATLEGAKSKRCLSIELKMMMEEYTITRGCSAQRYVMTLITMTGETMARPLKKTYSKTHPYVVERYDQEDGSISYEIWDTRPDTYRRLCSINEWNDGGDEDAEERPLSTAKADAEMIVRALNRMSGGLP
jgi:hypothetical protein